MKSRLLGAVLVSAVAALAVLVLACGENALPEGTVAKVGATFITEEQLDAEVTQEAAAYGITEEAYPDDYDEYYKSLREYVLQNLVLNELAAQEAAKLGFTVTDDEVQAQVDTYISSYAGDQAAFEADLKAGGLTLDTFKQNLKDGLLRDKVRQEVVKDVTSVPDEDVAAYYEANKSSYYVEPSRQLKHILIKPEAADAATGITEADWAAALATAAEVRTKLVATGDWTALAAEYSDDFATKDKGGDLGTVTKGQKVKEFEDAAFALELDDISQPIKTVYGYEIIQPTGITVGGDQTLDAVRDQIVAQLLAQAQEDVWNKWTSQRLAEANVIYRDDLRPEPTTTTEQTTTTVTATTTT